MRYHLKASTSNLLFVFAFCFLVALSLRSRSGLGIDFSPSPHDAELYLSLAHDLASGNAYGQYSSTTLLKGLAFSNLLALFRALGITYTSAIYSLNLGLALAIASIYFFIKRSKLVFFWVFSSILFFPLAFTHIWHQLLREPLNCLAVLCLSYSTLILLYTFFTVVPTLLHISIFSLYSFSITVVFFLREEGFILFFLSFIIILATTLYADTLRRASSTSLLPSFSGSYNLLPHLIHNTLSRRSSTFRFLLLMLFSSFIIFSIYSAQLVFLASHYRSSYTNDFSKGEFPRLISRLTTVCGSSDPEVSIPSACSIQLAHKSQLLAPVLSKIADPPTDSSNSYVKRYGKPGEWPNSHHYIWIHDAIDAVYSPRDAGEAQKLYRSISNSLDRAYCSPGSTFNGCRDGKLEHRDSLISLEFSSAHQTLMIAELLRGLNTIFNLSPSPFLYKTSAMHPSPKIRKIFREVVGADISAPVDDTVYLSKLLQSDSSALIEQSIQYMLNYPDVAQSLLGNSLSRSDRINLSPPELENLKDRAIIHFVRYGQAEGRSWPIPEMLKNVNKDFLKTSSRPALFLKSRKLSYLIGITLLVLGIFLSSLIFLITFLPLGWSQAFFVSHALKISSLSFAFVLILILIFSSILAVISATFGNLDSRMYLPQWTIAYSFFTGLPPLILKGKPASPTHSFDC